MIDCNIISDSVLCVRRACFWVAGDCQHRMPDDIRPNATQNCTKEFEEDDEGRPGMLWWFIPIAIFLVLVLCRCCYDSGVKRAEGNRRDVETGGAGDICGGRHQSSS